MERNCKSTECRCSQCGKKGHQGEECVEIAKSCLFCGGAHAANNQRACPEFARQKDIKTRMSTLGISYYEASTSNPRNNYYSILENASQFAPLTEEPTTAFTTPRPARSYAAVAREDNRESNRRNRQNTYVKGANVQHENDLNVNPGPSNPIRSNPYKCTGCERLMTVIAELQKTVQVLNEKIDNLTASQKVSVDGNENLKEREVEVDEAEIEL